MCRNRVKIAQSGLRFNELVFVCFCCCCSFSRLKEFQWNVFDLNRSEFCEWKIFLFDSIFMKTRIRRWFFFILIIQRQIKGIINDDAWLDYVEAHAWLIVFWLIYWYDYYFIFLAAVFFILLFLNIILFVNVCLCD